jgi:hypothetical protein
MSLPAVHIEVSVTITMTEAQARDVMDDLIILNAIGFPSFSSDGSRDVYDALSQQLQARVL